MKITPSNGGNPGSIGTTKVEQQLSYRDRAIAKLEESMRSSENSQQYPVANPTSVSPEEMTGLQSAMTEARQTSTSEESVAQAPVTDAVDTASAEGEKSEPLSSQYAILARKEKALRLKEQQLKAKEAALKQDETKTPTTPAPTFDEKQFVNKERLMKDPFTVLAELGLTYDQLTEMVLQSPKQEDLAVKNELRALREELASLKGETQSTKKTFEEQQQLAYKQAVSQIHNDVKTLVASNPNFETIKETDSVGDVVELIEQTFKEDGILLTVEEAAQKVEDYLVEEAMKLAKIKKIQQKLQPAPVSVATEEKTTTSPKQQQMKTLTNSISTSRQLSARERAILAMEGKLK